MIKMDRPMFASDLKNVQLQRRMEKIQKVTYLSYSQNHALVVFDDCRGGKQLNVEITCDLSTGKLLINPYTVTKINGQKITERLLETTHNGQTRI